VTRPIGEFGSGALLNVIGVLGPLNTLFGFERFAIFYTFWERLSLTPHGSATENEKANGFSCRISYVARLSTLL
jgi:hypothetical protein